MKVLTAAVVAIIILAFVSHKQQETASTVACGTVTGGTTMTAKGVDWAQEFGEWIHDLAETPVGPETVKAAVKGVERVLWFWLRSWFLSAKGLQLDPSIIELQRQAAAARAAAEQQCTSCPQALPQDSSPLASIGAATPTGSPEEITRQVAARYWPADQVDMAVAIAGAESSYNPKAHNNYGTGVDGLWQINRQAHPDLVAGKNLQDPSVNAALAYRIWSDAGNSWTPWTTYTSGAYKRFLKPSAAAKLTASVQGSNPELGIPNSTPVNPQNVGCQSSGMPEARIATWNTYVGNSNANVVAGMKVIAKQADIIGTQEMSDPARKTAVKNALGPDWQATALNTSHPIWFDTKAYTLTDQTSTKIFDRGTPMEGPDQGDRYINTATLRHVTDGKTLTVVNFHQLPQIQKNGRLNASWPKRIQQARDIFAAAMTAARVGLSRGAVVVVGDTNYTADPDGDYRNAGLTSAADILGAPDQKSRSRDIDKILYSAGAPSSYRSLGQFGSDHQARVAVFAGNTTSTSAAVIAGTRSVTDPTSHKTYQVQIPAGPRGVAINYAMDQLGKPYVWGAHGPNAFDCSGLMSAAWGKAGVIFTPQTEAMYREIPHTNSPQPGDITYHPGHVQMVLNDGLILEAANPRVPLRIIDRNWMKPTAYFDPTKMERP